MMGLPLDIHNDFATYETQFGHVQRPTHKNTTWDMAKFEVCGHKVGVAMSYVPTSTLMCWLCCSTLILASLDMESLFCPNRSMDIRVAVTCYAFLCFVRPLRRTQSKIKVSSDGTVLQCVIF